MDGSRRLSGRAASLVLALAACASEPAIVTPEEPAPEAAPAPAAPPATPAAPQPQAPVPCVPAPGRLDLADVSFLFPLPAALDATPGLVALSESGPRGPLLPDAVASALPAPLSPFTTLEDVRVVAVRVDPCFAPGEPGEPCRRQIRLVAQPLRAGAVGVETDDATVHLFYDVTQGDFAEVVDRLHALKQRAGAETDCKPLGVHPVIVREGLGGEYAVELTSLFRDHCGAANLTRVAVMQLGRPGGAWFFSAFDVRAGKAVADPIPRLGDATRQLFSLSDTAVDTGDLSPAPASPLRLLLRKADLEAAPLTDVEAAAVEAQRLDNPARANPGTDDCVSCHLAGRGREQARRLRGVDGAAAPEAFVNPGFDLALQARDGLESQRAFGYMGARPSLTERVVHESAVVARALSRP